MKNELACVIFSFCLLGIFDASAEQRIEDHELNAGPVKIMAHEDCDVSSGFKQCTVTATLIHGQQQITVDQIIREGGIHEEQHALTANDVAWLDSRYITLAYQTLGNCSDCGIGMHVVAFEDGKFFNVGKFWEYKDGSWTKTYSNLMGNSITKHATAPNWTLYFSYTNHEAVLDLAKTCDAEKTNYDSRKKDALEGLSNIKKLSKKLKPRDYEGWFEQWDGSPLLYTLGLSKFCGWKDDYAKLWDVANKKMGQQIMEKFENDLAGVVYGIASE